MYPDPESFRPERWLSPEFPTTYREPLTTYPNMHNWSVYGFGRRICPGQHIAERSLNIFVARVTWACSISKTPGDNAAMNDYASKFNVRPKNFKMNLEARSQDRLRVVRDALCEGEESDPLKTS